MSNIWSNYESRVLSHGNTSRERALKRLKRQLNHKLPSSLSYSRVVISGKDRDVAIVKSDEGMDFKTMFSMPNETFDRGSLVEWEDNYWLIIEHDVQDEIYTRATIQQCNYVLTWVNKSGKIIKRNCIIDNNDRNSSGEREGKVITLGDNRLNLILAKDDETKEIFRGQRFLIDDPDAEGNILAYQVTKPDRLPKLYSGKGVYFFGLRECNLSENDNTELMIADYDKVRKELVGNVNEEYRIVLKQQNDYLTIGETYKLEASLVATSDQDNFNSEIVYEVMDGQDYLESVKQEGSTLYIKPYDKYKNIGNTVSIKVSSSYYDVFKTIEFTIRGWA